MKTFSVLLCFLIATVTVKATVYFDEKFSADWMDRWVVSSEWKDPKELGKWKLTAGQYHADKDDLGIQTSEDARFYGISAEMSEVMNNESGDLILQFSVKHEQKLDCGGAYIKLLPEPLDQKNFGGDSEYAIMFGPDVCGHNRRTHAIFNYKGKNILSNKNFKVETDQLSHLYTLIIRDDNTFVFNIDNEMVESGNLSDEWDFLGPKEIQDPNESKPSDWVDEKLIPDPTETKPDGWDDIPATIPDPDAEMPEDWDEEDDGEWEPPVIDNPDYQGVWKPKMIANPDYKGEWVHPMIPNPEYSPDDKLFHVCKKCKFVGFELWQVKSGTIFDNILVTDDIEVAEDAALEFLDAAKVEKELFEAGEEKKRQKEEEERKKAEAEYKAQQADDDDDDDDDDEHDEL